MPIISSFPYKRGAGGVTHKIGDIVGSVRNLEIETNGEYIACDQRVISASAYPEYSNSISDRLGIFEKIVDTNYSATAQVCLSNYSYIDDVLFFWSPVSKTMVRHPVDTDEYITIPLPASGAVPTNSAYSAHFIWNDVLAVIFANKYIVTYAKNGDLIGVSTFANTITGIEPLNDTCCMVFATNVYVTTDRFVSYVQSTFAALPNVATAPSTVSNLTMLRVFGTNYTNRSFANGLSPIYKDATGFYFPHTYT